MLQYYLGKQKCDMLVNLVNGRDPQIKADWSRTKKNLKISDRTNIFFKYRIMDP